MDLTDIRCQLGRKIRPDLIGPGNCSRIIGRIQQPPQISAGVAGSFLRDLVPDLRDMLVIEQEGQCAVEGALPPLTVSVNGSEAREKPLSPGSCQTRPGSR